jgi:hypothetical protein
MAISRQTLHHKGNVLLTCFCLKEVENEEEHYEEDNNVDMMMFKSILALVHTQQQPIID